MTIDELVPTLADQQERGKTRKTRLLVAGAIAVASIAGYAISAIPAAGNQAAQEEQIAALEDENAALEDENAALEDEKAGFEEQIASAEARADEEIAATIASYEGRNTDLAQRESDVAAKEAEVAQRETAVTQTEMAIDASKIWPGTYLVPEELTAGRYRTLNDVNGKGCYMSQDKGNDILNNLFEDAGRPVFTVTNVPGSTFTIDSDCGPVSKI